MIKKTQSAKESAIILIQEKMKSMQNGNKNMKNEKKSNQQPNPTKNCQLKIFK